MFTAPHVLVPVLREAQQDLPVLPAITERLITIIAIVLLTQVRLIMTHLVPPGVAPVPPEAQQVLPALPVIIGHPSITTATAALTMGALITTLPAVLYAVKLTVPVAVPTASVAEGLV